MANPFSHLDDQRLMELYNDGENMAFEVIYYRYKDTVYSYLSKRVQDKNLVEDIYQNVFIKFHKSRHLYNSKHLLIKWIYVITRSVLLDTVKNKKVQLVEFDEKYFVVNERPKHADLDFSDFKNLTSNERLALEMRYYQEEDFSEIAKKLNTSQVNTRKLVSRALKKLRAKLVGSNNER